MDENVQKRGNIEYIPTEDFFHRQNKSFFWLLTYIIPFANNVIFRYLLGKVYLTNNLHKAVYYIRLAIMDDLDKRSFFYLLGNLISPGDFYLTFGV